MHIKHNAQRSAGVTRSITQMGRGDTGRELVCGWVQIKRRSPFTGRMEMSVPFIATGRAWVDPAYRKGA